MRFGPVAVAEALGAVLAHTHRLNGEHIAKGTVLTDAHVALLQAGGVETVLVARLDPDDLDENESAAQVAAALSCDGIEARPATTGRANLHATRRGVLGVDRMRIDDVNLVHESITLATIEPWSIVDAGALVATVKVIPFASPKHVVGAATARAREALSLRALPRRTAGMIVTELPGSSATVARKGIDAMRTRLEQHGSRLGRVLHRPHQLPEITAALIELLDCGCEPILLLGASATVDRHDVLPTALQAVGGVIDHLGMPMDPGNQIFLGHRGEVSVIGVPGCARTTRPGGFDVVLRRVLAGARPDRHAIMRLGVGGLQKEGKARREPRRLGAMVLAAGQSRRMGADNKLLLDISGAPMVTHVVDALLASAVVDLVVVTGHDPDAVRAALSGRPLRFAHNADFTAGMSTSLHTGIRALAEDARIDGALVALGDMPYVRTRHIDALLAAFDDGASIAVPVRAGRRGNPVLWAREHFDRLLAVTGDQGGREVIRAHAASVVEVDVDDDAVLVDLDTPEALARALGTS